MKKKSINLFTFSANFTSENSCREHFKLERDKFGLACTSCNNTPVPASVP